MEFQKVKIFIEEFLPARLSPFITYHDYFHTLDVLSASIELARIEHITDPDDLVILKTAALFHDTGFINVYKEHEEEGCRLAEEHLPKFEYSEKQIEAVCKLILVTKVPQAPVTLLEQILCDADLDYLGREDYPVISQKLYIEWREKGHVLTEKEWISLQIKFLESHHYWTKSASVARSFQKEKNLQVLKDSISV